MPAHSESVPDPLSHPIDYWVIEPDHHYARHDLEKWIMPYMAMGLPKAHSLQSFVQRHPWAEEFIESEDSISSINTPHRFDRITAMFDTDPKAAVANLSHLNRLLSFTLVRYSFRTRVHKGRGGWQGSFNIRSLNEEKNYTRAISKERQRKLARNSRRYGPWYYNECYEHARERKAWTSFCEAIQNFCRSVGFTTPADDPESNVWKLGDLCQSLFLDRKISRLEERLRGELGKTSYVVRKNLSLNRANQSLGTLNVSLGISELEEIQRSEQRLRQEIQNSEQRLRHDMRSMEQRLLSAIQSHHTSVDQRLQVVIDRIEQQGAASQQTFQSLEGKIDGIHSGIGEIRTSIQDVKKYIAGINSDSEDFLQSFKRIERRLEGIEVELRDSKTAAYILKKRGILENLIDPPTYWYQNNGQTRKTMIGAHWGDCWEQAWKRAPGSPDHPLHHLSRDPKSHNLYNIGKFLYSTLSELIHSFFENSNINLDPDAERILDALTPKCWTPQSNIDWVEERKRYKK